jgi:hypothetical protein
MPQNDLHVRFGNQQQIIRQIRAIAICPFTQTEGSHLDLTLRLFPGNIKNPIPTRHFQRRLQQQRALSDSWIAPNEHDRARHNTSPQHPGKFLNWEQHALICPFSNFGEPLRGRISTQALNPGGSLFARLRDHFLYHAVPGITLRAAPHIFG